MTDKIKLDIISDVVCPWCIIGYNRLEGVISQNKNKQTQLKLRLFEAFFSERKDVSNRQVLAGELEAVGLDVEDGLASLENEAALERIQGQESYWHGMGVSSVPTMVFNQSGVLKGPQGIDTYKMVLTGLMDKEVKILM